MWLPDSRFMSCYLPTHGVLFPMMHYGQALVLAMRSVYRCIQNMHIKMYNEIKTAKLSTLSVI